MGGRRVVPKSILNCSADFESRLLYLFSSTADPPEMGQYETTCQVWRLLGPIDANLCRNRLVDPKFTADREARVYTRKSESPRRRVSISRSSWRILTI